MNSLSKASVSGLLLPEREWLVWSLCKDPRCTHKGFLPILEFRLISQTHPASFQLQKEGLHNDI